MADASSKNPVWDDNALSMRALSMWMPRLASAEVDYGRRRDIDTGRARDLAINSAYGANALRIHRDNVIGPTFTLALRPIADLLEITPIQAKKWSRQVERAWKAYADSPTYDCDAQRVLTFPWMLHQAYLSFMTSGDALGIMRWKDPGPSGFRTCLQLVEPDRLSTPPELEMLRTIHRGVERDADGVPIAYHVRKVHASDVATRPVDQQFKWERIPRAEKWGRPKVLHMIDRSRPDMVRGISSFVAALVQLKMVDEYDRAELESAVLKASFAAVVKTELPTKQAMAALGAGDLADEGDLANEDAQHALSYMAKIGGYHQASALTVNGARAVHLLPGESMELLQAAEGGISYEAFTRAMVNKLAAGLGVGAEQLSRDFGEMSFASAKMALGDIWRHYRVRREMLIRQFAMPWVLCWLEEAVDTGALPLPNGQKGDADSLLPMWPAIFANSTFLSWGPPVVDPVKEAQAQETRLKIGISTLAQEAQEQGDDWEDLLEQQALERAKKAELEIPQIEELEAKEDPLMGGKDDDPDEDGKGGEKKGKEQRRA